MESAGELQVHLCEVSRQTNPQSQEVINNYGLSSPDLAQGCEGQLRKWGKPDLRMRNGGQ